MCGKRYNLYNREKDATIIKTNVRICGSAAEVARFIQEPRTRAGIGDVKAQPYHGIQTDHERAGQ